MKLKLKYIFLIGFLLFGMGINVSLGNETPSSTKKERNHITKGNRLYEENKYQEALKEYKLALEENPSSQVARYNMGLTEIKIGSNPNDTTEAAKRILQSGIKDMQQIANLGNKRPDLAAKAYYNLGNVAYNSQDYGGAVEYYKSSLRLNPEDENTRRNLRLAQLKIQNDQDNQNNDQQENQDQNEDQQQDQNENKDQDQENNQEENQNQDQNQEQNENQQPQSSLNEQTAEQILNAMENKENQTRARVAGQNAEKSKQRNRNRRNW